MMERPAGLIATKDGVTVAREVDPAFPIHRMGARILREACLKVNEEVGDGTTTTAVLAAAILREGHKLVAAGEDPLGLVREIREAAQEVCHHISTLASPVDDQGVLKDILLVASNGDDEIAETVSEGCMAIGVDGTMVIEDGYQDGLKLVYKDGMEVPTIIKSRVIREEIPFTLEGPHVAVIDRELTSYRDVRSLIQEASRYQPPALLIVARRVTAEALDTIVMNCWCDSRIRGSFQVGILEAWGFGPWKTEYLKDTAALAGATLVDQVRGMDHKEWNPEWLGSFRRVVVGHEKTLLTSYQENQESALERVRELKLELGSSTSEHDRDRYRQRIAKLVGGLCVLEVGGPTEAALKERRGRLEDALACSRASLEEGVVPGGGIAYLEGADLCVALEPSSGRRVLAEALCEPLRRIAMNAGVDPGAVVEKVRQARLEDDTGWCGWDARGGVVRDLGEGPVVADPLRVVLSAISSAVSVGTTLLTAEVAITGGHDGCF